MKNKYKYLNVTNLIPKAYHQNGETTGYDFIKKKLLESYCDVWKRSKTK